MESVTVGSANVMKAGMVELVSIQLLAILHGGKAMKCARILKISSVLVQAHVSVAGANVLTQKKMDWYMASFVNVMTENALMMKQERFVQVAEESRTHKVFLDMPSHGKCYCGNCYCEAGWHGDKCEFQCDITPWEIKKRCTSPDGKICSNRGTCVCGECTCHDVDPTGDWGDIHGDTCECDERNCKAVYDRYSDDFCSGRDKKPLRSESHGDIIGNPVMDSVIVEDVTVKKDGLGKSVNIHIHVQCQLKKALRNAKEILIYLALEEVSPYRGV
ncbi:hypothetical protein DV515_00003860 [Chloebia gouldiae]|uniref:EGF-like domain-containing protein n=1 Tax=Chloebia gouldiae TaxID=44316 RepID=A0A3L8SST5_CHLGU|nr:hypothetical protein DV515_00003860 [Chloebia gouldiae]